MGFIVKTQLASKHLIVEPKSFLLKPDIAVFDSKKGKLPIVILDTKWKLIDKNKSYENGVSDPKSSISQSDMYQMFAYGHKYIGGHGKLVLIYPQWEKFESKLATFKFDKQLTLDVIPFDLNATFDQETLNEIFRT